jgi:hypothetical protein
MGSLLSEGDRCRRLYCCKWLRIAFRMVMLDVHEELNVCLRNDAGVRVVQVKEAVVRLPGFSDYVS